MSPVPAPDENPTLSELIDIREMQELCNSFTDFTGAATAIVDLKGIVLVAAGWHEICTRFHRVNPITAARCTKSDTVLAGKMKKGERHCIYKCENGLVDIAVPITVNGRHMANFFTGQFFLDIPDKKRFEQQAEEFGFNKTAYMDAVDRVPFFSDDFVKIIVEFLVHLTYLIGQAGRAGLQPK
jgi:ligand-binding sensor protein